MVPVQGTDTVSVIIYANREVVVTLNDTTICLGERTWTFC